MTESVFDNALSSLKRVKEVDRLQKILLVIRKEVEWPTKKDNICKVQKKGCLKDIVECLLKPQVSVLNTTLSILGNCCMLREIAKEVVKEHNMLNNISHVLKRHPQDSIRGRAYRILGNLLQHLDYHGALLIKKNPQLQIISNVIVFLKLVAKSDDVHNISFEKETTNKDNNVFWSNATLCMALRTLRGLVNANTIVALVEEYEVIKVIGMITVKFTPIWVNTMAYGDVLETVLKCLHTYSIHTDVDLIPDLQNCGTGNAMDSLGKLLCLSPYLLVKMIMNMLKNSKLRSDLPIAEMAGNLIHKLGNLANFTDGIEDLKYREYLKCLCFLLHHPANKEDLRNLDVIPAFISSLRNSDELTEISLKNALLIISTLRICMYDQTSLVEMLKYDIIGVLIAKLNWAIGIDSSMDLSHVYRHEPSSKKRRKFIINKCFMHKLTSDGLGFPCCSVRSDLPCNYIKYSKERSLSPSSDVSFSSGPSSPSNPVLSEGEDSDDYSPVCSDSEEADAKHPTVEEGDMIYSPSPCYEEMAMNTIETTTGDKDIQNTKKRLYTLCNEVTKLIKLFTKLRPVVMELVASELLLKLLKLLLPKNANCCPPDTLAIILLIVETPEYLLRLMQTDFVTAAYKLSIMSHGSECITCTNLNYISRSVLFKFTIVVESGSGKGDIAHQLHRASLPIKQRLVLALPFVTDNKYLFLKLMMDCGGLNILIQLLQDHSSTPLRCICSLSVLAKKLRIKNPTERSQEQTICMPIDLENYKLNDACLTKVCFKLDDGSFIQADRTFLCQKSEYFRCLLSGEFKESCESEVALHNVPCKALKLLLLLLHIDVNSTDIYNIDADLDLLLEVIALSESYLLVDLCNSLTLSVQYFKLFPNTIPAIYQWSLESGTDILRVESVAYALVADMNDSDRNNIFKNLLELGYCDKIANDIKQLLTRFLGPTKHL